MKNKNNFVVFPALGYWEIDGKPVSAKEAQYGLNPKTIWKETEVAKQMTTTKKSSAIINCQLERDRLICNLWAVFSDMSELQDSHDFTDEDTNLWELLTSHSAIQKKLKWSKQ